MTIPRMVPNTRDLEAAAIPVDVSVVTEKDRRGPEDGTALCLSGGGFRAMLFHLGSLWRMNELGLLRTLHRVSSVSGGSITAAQLGVRWSALDFDAVGVGQRYTDEVVAPLRRFASETIDWKAVVSGALSKGTIADKVAKAYRTHLFGEATLQDLPDERLGEAPRFVLNASNVQSGALWRFSKPYMRDYRVGCIRAPRLSLSTAVAASSAFPPFLSPLTLRLDPKDYEPSNGETLHRPPFTTQPVLTDGGVYDNLGLETAWKRYRRVYVSDGGGRMVEDPDPKTDWARHTRRVLGLIDNQVRSLRKRQIVASYQLPNDGGPLWRHGAYWGIWTDIADYQAPNALPCPHTATERLAAEPTRLAAIDGRTQERLINWGYAVCDAALRTFGALTNTPMPAFPYPAAAI